MSLVHVVKPTHEMIGLVNMVMHMLVMMVLTCYVDMVMPTLVMMVLTCSIDTVMPDCDAKR